MNRKGAKPKGKSGGGRDNNGDKKTMRPELLNKDIVSNGTFVITTVGGRKLTATPIFGKDKFGPIYFRVNKYEKIHADFVKEVDGIYDYYYSAQNDMLHGHWTTDGIKYTLAVWHNHQPSSNWEDNQLVATKTAGRIINKRLVNRRWESSRLLFP